MDERLLLEIRSYVKANYLGNYDDDSYEEPEERAKRPKADGIRFSGGFGGTSLISPYLLDEVSNLYEETFSEKCFKLMKKRGLKPADVCRLSGLTKSLLSKIKSDRDYLPSKETALALALVLRLTLEETADLLKKAGYSLSHSRKRDLVVEYFIKEGIYDADRVNISLYELGLPPLTHRRMRKDLENQ